MLTVTFGVEVDATIHGMLQNLIASVCWGIALLYYIDKRRYNV